MKIDIVVPFFYPIIGGAEVFTYELAKRLVKIGHIVNVHTAIYDLSGRKFLPYEKIEGIKVIRYKPFFKKYYYFWFWVPKINTTNIILVCGYGHMCFSLAIQLYKTKFPLVAIPIGVSAPIEGPKSRWIRDQYDKYIGVAQLKLCRKIIVLANEEKEWCIKRGILEEKIKRIPVGIPEISFLSYRNTYLGESARYIVYLGRIHKQKGIDNLIYAFNKVCKYYKELKLILIGPDNGYIEKLQSICEYLQIKDRVIWKSSVSENEKYELLSGCEFLVLPSKYELQGIVLAEAMAQGKPVIATNVGGIPDFVKDGVNGFLVPYGDVETLALKMDQLLKNKDLYRYMSNQAKKTAEEFRWEKIIKEYEQIFSEVL